MNYMKAKTSTGLTAEDIINIIKAGSEAKVANLCLNGLKVIYQPTEQASSPIQIEALTPITEPSMATKPNQNDALDEELRRESVMISDPSAFEESILIKED